MIRMCHFYFIFQVHIQAGRPGGSPVVSTVRTAAWILPPAAAKCLETNLVRHPSHLVSMASLRVNTPGHVTSNKSHTYIHSYISVVKSDHSQVTSQSHTYIHTFIHKYSQVKSQSSQVTYIHTCSQVQGGG